MYHPSAHVERISGIHIPIYALTTAPSTKILKVWFFELYFCGHLALRNISSSIIVRLTQKQTETFPLNKYGQSNNKWSHCDTKAFHATVTIPPPHDIDIHHHLFYVIFLQDMRGQYKLCWRHAISVIDMKSCKQCRVVTCTVLLIPSFLPCTMCIIVVNQHVFIWNLFCLNELLTSLSHVVFNVSVIFLSANDLLTAGTSFYPCDWEWLFCAIFW